MVRELTSAVQTASEQNRIRPVTIVFLDFPNEPVRVWSGLGSIEFEGNTYLGVGELGRISPLEETTTLKASRIDLELNGIPRYDENGVPMFALINETLSSHYQGREVRVWQAFLDEVGNIIPNPVLIWIGRMDVPEIASNAETIVVRLTAEHELVDLDRPRVRRYTSQDQKADFPGDRGLEYVVALQERDIVWGRVLNR